eukprot:TRINITY_DN3340_c0_g1_i2.p1 TRINITY_DN3340_c0_g1~~TRINITY_DN3340_c0_g1_i2.p1  ORF type:complete len:800 (-),score=319.88 TRINITY_DN3340_c0_g1_i2:184-2583(-)
MMMATRNHGMSRIASPASSVPGAIKREPHVVESNNSADSLPVPLTEYAARTFIAAALQPRGLMRNGKLRTLALAIEAASEGGGRAAAAAAHGAVDTRSLCTLYRGLSQCASLISSDDASHDALVAAVLRFDLGAEPRLFAAYSDFVLNLVSAHGNFVSSCFESLVRHFLPRPAPAAVQAQHPSLMPAVASSAAGSVLLAAGAGAEQHECSSGAGQYDLDGTQLHADRAHSLIEQLLRLMPTAGSSLGSVLARHFPHKRFDAATQRTYLCQLLRVAAYQPVLAPRILELCVDKLIQLDVAIRLVSPVDDDDDAAAADDDETLVFQCDDIEPQPADKPPTSAPAPNSNAPAAADSATTAAAAGDNNYPEVADKLDAMMSLMFAALDAGFGAMSDDELLGQLLRVFDAKLLCAHRSKFTQFLVFYACRRHPHESAGKFIAYLLNKLLDDSSPAAGHPAAAAAHHQQQLRAAHGSSPRSVGSHQHQHQQPTSAAAVSSSTLLTRQACAAYLASFVARAVYVTPPLVKSTLSVLIGWLAGYMQQYDDYRQLQLAHLQQLQLMQQQQRLASAASARRSPPPVSMAPPDPHQHSLFYAVCQAVLYIAVFHWSLFVGDDTALLGGGYFERVGFDRVLASDFHPLQHCLGGVVSEFVRRCQQAGWLWCARALDNDRRLVLASRSGAAGISGGRRRALEAFFPFDPYLLRDSSRFITQLYRAWQPDDSSSAAGRRINTSADANSSDDDSDADSELQQDEEDVGSLSSKDSSRPMSFKSFDGTPMSFENSVAIREPSLDFESMFSRSLEL